MEMKKSSLVVALAVSLFSLPVWAEMPGDMKMPADKMEGKQAKPMPHHDHAVEKGTLPPQHSHHKGKAPKQLDKEGKPMQRHDHTKDRH
jgi:hypothetical protein